jgi:hypothetical protein
LAPTLTSLTRNKEQLAISFVENPLALNQPTGIDHTKDSILDKDGTDRVNKVKIEVETATIGIILLLRTLPLLDLPTLENRIDTKISTMIDAEIPTIGTVLHLGSLPVIPSLPVSRTRNTINLARDIVVEDAILSRESALMVRMDSTFRKQLSGTTIQMQRPAPRN